MKRPKWYTKIFQTKNFGFIIAIIVILLMLALNTTPIMHMAELKITDLHFKLKTLFTKETLQEGVTYQQKNPNISDDILIIGVDHETLKEFGRWPFPRYRHANLIDSFARIQNQNERERAVFLDFFFNEPEDKAYNDAMLLESMDNNNRVFIETILKDFPSDGSTKDELYDRIEVLMREHGEITNITGDRSGLRGFYGLDAPLIPYSRASAGYGHANYIEDIDDIYRKQPLIARSSELVDIYRLENVTEKIDLNYNNFERLVWEDKDGTYHTVPYPITPEVISQLRIDMRESAPKKAVDFDNDRMPDDYIFTLRKYKDHFIPSITLSLALEYFNKDLSDLEIVIGKHIIIPEPQHYNVENQRWEPYTIVNEPAKFDSEGNLVTPEKRKVAHNIKIPINEHGQMKVNFMGQGSSVDGYQTFPVRPYKGYASRVPSGNQDSWPKTKVVGNKILMVGAFSKGMAADEKPTPFGLMYGIEIHANALNTILMDNFLTDVPDWVNIVILSVLVLFVAFLTSRSSTIVSFIVSIVLILVTFLTTTLIFDMYAKVIDFIIPAIGILLSFVSIVVYRVMTEEKDKKRIRNMFGKYVSPRVVDQILENPPELGGVDKELTVLFSDIRGFTTLSESMTPQELVNHLNQYLTAMTDLILEYQGTLDKYVGDEIMCFWGAPLPLEDHAYLACKCALKQMEVLGEMNKNWPEEKQINIGIGVNSGIMTVGNMGSLGRMNYTLMGDNVNLGARLEGTNKTYGTNIIISEYTYGLVKDYVYVRELDNIRVKGKNKPVLIYELMDVLEKDSPNSTEE